MCVCDMVVDLVDRLPLAFNTASKLPSLKINLEKVAQWAWGLVVWLLLT